MSICGVVGNMCQFVFVFRGQYLFPMIITTRLVFRQLLVKCIVNVNMFGPFHKGLIGPLSKLCENFCCCHAENNPWLRHQMETFSALLVICAGNSPVPGEFPSQRPVARSFDVFFDLPLNKRLSKQSWGWWFETPSWSLWRQCSSFDYAT